MVGFARLLQLRHALLNSKAGVEPPSDLAGLQAVRLHFFPLAQRRNSVLFALVKLPFHFFSARRAFLLLGLGSGF